ncbi:hypothetical protein GLOIN_2v1848971 [Rhizophagus irregularis DAOM 181602=DAOM 197198]|nr:hypothetical protein GLOIN_2v1848971 [Rhizophagus irregularis DAOM 181602=DAOM 197198]
MEQLLDTYESANSFPDTLTREEIMRVVVKAYGLPPKPQKPENLPQYTPPDSDNEEDGYDKILPVSSVSGINDPAIKALGWKADKPSNFAIKGNSKHITDSLGWYTDVPVTLKDKEDKTVTVIGNFVRIDNGETEPMLFFDMSNIRKVQGVPDLNKNQFRIKLHGKVYIILTFSKASVVKDPLKEDQDQTSTNSSSPNSEENLKKSA